MSYGLLNSDDPLHTERGMFPLLHTEASCTVSTDAFSVHGTESDLTGHVLHTGMKPAATDFTGGPIHKASIQCPLSLSLTAIGVECFLSHYVVPQSGPSTGFLDYVVSLLTHGDGHELLQDAILAVGFARLARATKQADLMSRSTTTYARTIERVNRVLANPVAARCDSTVVTVLVLSLYEFGRASLDGWKRHINGAASLLCLRGNSQFSSLIGIQIFKDVFTQLLIECARIGIPIPSNLRILRSEASKVFDKLDPFWVATSAMVELLDLYHRISPGRYPLITHNSTSQIHCPPESSPSSVSMFANGSHEKPAQPGLSIEDVERHLSNVLEIDSRLESTFADCPAEWCYAVIPKKPDEVGVGKVLHVYHDVYVVNVWNTMRTCRILANHAVCYLVLRGAAIDSSWFLSNCHVKRLQGAHNTLALLRADLMATVPQLVCGTNIQIQQQLGYPALQITALLPTSPATPLGLPELGSGYCGSAAGAYFAAWTLLTLGTMHSAPNQTRRWSITQLRHISQQAHLAQASEFARFIEEH